MGGIRWALDESRTTVTISFPTEPPLLLEIDLAEVEAMIEALGAYRAAMVPRVEDNWPVGQGCAAIVDPKWITEPEVMHGESLLHLRDPRFGWLHYRLPPREALALATLLRVQAQTAPEPPERGAAH